MKIAVVKSSVYQDLWVTDISNNPRDLFKSSMMRCPPIGLAEKYGADFIIVEDTDEYPCQSNKNCLPIKFNETIQFSKENKNPTLPFLDETYHKDISINDVSHSVDTIDWSKYNIVMCINTCIPARIIQKYPQVFWCYWVGENEDNLVMNKVSCYNLVLNQDVCKQGLPEFSIGFPYTYIGPKTIESIVKLHYNIGNLEKQGIYMEINNTTERPVKTIPDIFLTISTETGHPIIRHSQNIIENAKNLFGAKYYVKLLGRKIRGNSTLESISAGTLVLANSEMVTYDNLILPECHIKSYSDAILKIKYYDEHPVIYQEAIQRQRDILNIKYFKGPYEKLIDAYKLKK
jgi:hypothetical protein